MKKFIISLISLLVSFTFIFVTVPSVAVADSSTIVEIPNSGFEETKRVNSFSTKVIPEKWTLKTSHLYLTSNVESPSYNDKCVCVAKGCSEFIFSSANEDMVIEVIGGKEYTFGYYCLADSGVVTASITVDTFDIESEKVDSNVQTYEIENSGDWQNVFVTFTAKENAVTAILTLTVNAKSSACYIDEVYGYYNDAVAAVTTFTGASLRLALDSPGIRFAGSVNKDVYDEYVKNYTEVSAGILITLEEYLTGKTDFTVDALGDNPYVEITAEKWFNQNTIDADGYYGFYCAIIKINQKNIEKRYCARSYVKYKDGEKFRYVYGNFSLADNARSVKETAELAMEELELYSDEQTEIIRYFAEFNN